MLVGNPQQCLLVALLLALASLSILVQGTSSRFNRNEARCAVICSNRDSDECRICNTRIPMRFGKRGASYRLYEALPLALVEDQDSQYGED